MEPPQPNPIPTPGVAAPDRCEPVGLATIGRFLVGRRDAIETVAADRRSPGIGLALVFAAGLAREYDAEWLTAEPWHLLVAPGASLGAAFALFVVVALTLIAASRDSPSTASTSMRFLGLFWMTAPLAFIYAIPVERFLGELDAVRANLWMLGLVAAWRVVLMIRVVSVFTGRSTLASAFPVMLMSAGLAIAAISTLDVQIFAIMGGIHQTPAEKILRTVGSTTLGLSIMTLPVWLVGSVVIAVRTHRMRAPLPALPAVDAACPRPRGPWILVAGMIALLSAALPMTQAEQARARRVENSFWDGEYDAGIEILCRNDRDAFPPHWEPPRYRMWWYSIDPPNHHPDILEVARRLVRDDAPAWFVERHGDALRRLAAQVSPGEDPDVARAHQLLRTLAVWPAPLHLDDDNLANLARLVNALPEHARGTAQAEFDRVVADEVPHDSSD